MKKFLIALALASLACCAWGVEPQTNPNVDQGLRTNPAVIPASVRATWRTILSVPEKTELDAANASRDSYASSSRAIGDAMHASQNALASAAYGYASDTRAIAAAMAASQNALASSAADYSSGTRAILTTLTTAVATGTSGTKVPLLDGANTWDTTQTFTVAPVFTASSAALTAMGGAHLNAINVFTASQRNASATVVTGFSGGTTRRHIYKRCDSSGVATSVFRIETTDEAGSTDGGHYSVFVRGTVGHGSANTTSTGACKSFSATFCRVSQATGAGVNSAVSEQTESGSAAINGATRDVGEIVMTVAEETEYSTTVLFNTTVSGTDPVWQTYDLIVEVVYGGYLTAPTISETSVY